MELGVRETARGGSGDCFTNQFHAKMIISLTTKVTRRTAVGVLFETLALNIQEEEIHFLGRIYIILRMINICC